MFISRIGTCCTEQSKAVISRGTLSKEKSVLYKTFGYYEEWIMNYKEQRYGRKWKESVGLSKSDRSLKALLKVLKKWWTVMSHFIWE